MNRTASLLPSISHGRESNRRGSSSGPYLSTVGSRGNPVAPVAPLVTLAPTAEVTPEGPVTPLAAEVPVGLGPPGKDVGGPVMAAEGAPAIDVGTPVVTAERAPETDVRPPVTETGAPVITAEGATGPEGWGVVPELGVGGVVPCPAVSCELKFSKQFRFTKLTLFSVLMFKI